MRPSAYSHPTRDIRLVETHISWVFLTGDYAYKLKKPVDLGFLDFSTLELRRHFCEEELRLNRRLVPDLYLDVVAIRGSHEAPVVDGKGELVDYAVRMHQFDLERQLDVELGHRSRRTRRENRRDPSTFLIETQPPGELVHLQLTFPRLTADLEKPLHVALGIVCAHELLKEIRFFQQAFLQWHVGSIDGCLGQSHRLWRE